MSYSTRPVPTNKLKSYRLRAIMPQTVLAKRARVSQVCISEIENHKRWPADLTCVKIAKGLKQDVTDVFPAMRGKV